MMRAQSAALLVGVLALAPACKHADGKDVSADVHRPHHHGHLPHGDKDGEATSDHRFEDAEKWAGHFEDPERDAWQKPERVIEALQLEPSLRVADIGAATGYFPVRIAAHVPRGHVWGVDIEPDMVRFLDARADKEGLTNLSGVLGTVDDARLPEPVDRVLLVNTYHHIGQRVAYFSKLAASLRPGAKLVIVDFKKGELPIGPRDEHKLAPDVVIDELQRAGYVAEAQYHERLPYQYVLVLTRAP